MSQMSAAYRAALAAHDAAIAEFNRVRDAYRAGGIGDSAFLAARVKYDEETALFDVAYDLESGVAA